jgi:phosphatidylglycerol lysyltransferase
MRDAMSRAERDGWRLEVLPPQAVPARLGELRVVSDAWLQGRGARERGFAEGRFDEAYLRRTPVVIAVRAGRIAAFANLWSAAGREELTVDLLRYTPDAPPRIMDYLLAGTMAWGATEGYRWFTLGMGPLPGPETKSLSPFWHRVGAMAFRFGEHFESVQALREYKESFAPTWTPRYLALPGGLRMARSLRDLASLVSGT